MLVVKGMYHDGQIELESPILTGRPLPILVTFLEEITTNQAQPVSSRGLNRFSFAKTREKLKNLNICLSDAVIEERVSAR